MNRLVLVALGSNRGDSVAIVRGAIGALARFARGELRASHLWRTSPIDCPPGSPDFVNAVVAFDARDGLTCDELLDALKALERDYGRDAPVVKNAPRELDLDLLLFGSEIRDSVRLRLPHPRAHLRRFVLAPAAEIAENVVWPRFDRTIAELLAGLTDHDGAMRID
jgi:2-amino-4-hydroxy-6-hydroxymethyldihydropteridine diphosphokinase